MKYDQKFRAMKFLLGVKIGFKIFFFFFFAINKLGRDRSKKKKKLGVSCIYSGMT